MLEEYLKKTKPKYYPPVEKGINIILMVALIIIVSAWPIYHHIQNRKLKEIYLVLENDKLKTCTVMNTNMKNKNLKDAD